MKQRFNALDIRATVINLRERLVDLRLQNIYDVNAKTFLFKFAKPDDKELVLIESGVRIHSTQFSREKNAAPSQFCSKLRKHLRTRRLTHVRQVGVDRIVDFEFSGGEKSTDYHLIAEFYASGNILLTDHKYRILALLRVVQTSDNVRMAVGEVYDMKNTLSDFKQIDVDELRMTLKKAGPKISLKKMLNSIYEYGPAMAEHIVLDAGLDPNMKVSTEFDHSKESPMLDTLIESLKKADALVASTANQVPKGYIIFLDPSKDPRPDHEKTDIFDEFHPFLYKQHASKRYKAFPSFDAAVDEFFSALEAQKIELKSRQQESVAQRKMNSVLKEQTKRAKNLMAKQITNERKAQLIEQNLDKVDAAITIIRNAVASQMDWRDLEELVANEKKRGNPIAILIDQLKLEKNQITLRLTEPENEDRSHDEDTDKHDSDEDDSDQEQDKDQVVETFIKDKDLVVHLVDIHIDMTAFANACKYYEEKKMTASKYEKTIAVSTRALKSAERKIRQDLKETQITTTINKIRKPYWFEKFLWFITTEGHLVIAGRDMLQNEMIVKRYLHKEDIYVHADIHGAASVVVKQRPQNAGKPIPPTSLYQAGIMSVCQSRAWEAKIVTSAYWVYPSQVSKSAPTGEYLTTGSFMIRGKKNFLPPVQLVYGFGYLFKLDDSSLENHLSDNKHLDQDEDQRDPHDTQKVSSLDDGHERVHEDLDQDRGVHHDKRSDNDNDSPVANLSIENDPRNINQDVQEDASKTQSHSTEDEESSSSSSSSSTSSDASEDEFPDTQLAVTQLAVEPASEPGASEASTEWTKYDLKDYGQVDDNDDLPEFARVRDQPIRERKKVLSAKERRQLKKGKTGNSETTPKSVSSEPATQKSSTKPVAHVHVRGKKGKIKKIKEKYSEQDEEERQLRMAILGSDKGPQPKGKKAKKEARIQAEKEALAKEREAQLRAQAQADQGEQGPGKQEEVSEATRHATQDNMNLTEADEVANVSVLDSLTPTPLPHDILHFALPVCAPYAALQKYKYKVKLTPGTVKRSKAIKQAQSVFFNLSDATAREKELIKCVPEMEAIAAMMSKVKLSAPNFETSNKKKSKK